MPFATIADSTTTVVKDTNASSREVTIPAHAEGDLVLLLIGTRNAASVTSIDDVNSVAWSQLANGTNTFTGFAVYELVAGSDDASPATVTVTFSASHNHTTALALLLAGAEDTVLAGAAFTGTAPNPPNLAPPAGSDDYLWLTGWMSYANTTAYPSGYTEVDEVGDTASTNYPKVAVASKTATASSDDPAAGTVSSSVFGWTFTIAVSPGAQPISPPALTPATVHTPAVANTQIATVAAVAAAAVHAPTVSLYGLVEPPLLSAATVADPTVAVGAAPVAAQLLAAAAVHAPNVFLPVVAPRLAAATVSPPIVGKAVALDAEAHVTFAGTALATVTLTIDATPANDDPLTVGAGTLQLAENAATGATTLVLAATTLTGTVEAGDTLTIAGTVFTVTGSATAEGNEITVTVAPPVPA